MHQQQNGRNCRNEAVGGAHYGPANVYLSKVADAATADGSAPWYKIFSNAWAAQADAGPSDSDHWGTNDLDACWGRMDVPIPADTPAGDYLLRAEVIALHTAGGAGGAVPAGVALPGAFKVSDPGILVNIQAKISACATPGPAVVPGGEVRTPGLGCTSCEKTCEA